MIAVPLPVAWRAFQVHWRVLVPAMLLLLGSWVVLEVSVVALQRFGVLLNVALHTAFLFVFSGLLAGVQGLALQIVDGVAHPRWMSVATMMRCAPRALGAGLLYALAVAMGLLLFVVPGVYLAVRLAFFGPFLASGEVSATEALARSAALTRGRSWVLFRLLAVCIALNLAGAALLGLGLLVTMPVTLLAFSGLFRVWTTAPSLTGRPASRSSAPPPRGA